MIIFVLFSATAADEVHEDRGRVSFILPYIPNNLPDKMQDT